MKISVDHKAAPVGMFYSSVVVCPAVLAVVGRSRLVHSESEIQMWLICQLSYAIKTWDEMSISVYLWHKGAYNR